eukprot:681852-Pleurochrysis_carterae.AAC.1
MSPSIKEHQGEDACAVLCSVAEAVELRGARMMQLECNNLQKSRCKKYAGDIWYGMVMTPRLKM